MTPSYRRSSTLRGSFNLYLTFLLCAIFTLSDTTFAYSWLPPRRENSPKPTSTLSGNTTALAAASTATIEYSSAVAIESKVSYQLSQLATVPAIPLPTDLPYYDILNQVAGLMPPLQTGSVQNNSVQMLAAMRDNLRPSENSTTVGMEHLYERATKLKVIIVGDSISQGREGDFTWRYRIWEWFQSQGIEVDFVGPYTGTVQPDKPAPPSPPALYGEPQPTGVIKVSGGYAKEVSSDFPKNHFAVWGRAAAVDKDLIKEVMAAHPADLMLLLLGFNDMGWFYSDSMGTLDSIHTLISNTRAANPKIKFAIANVPQRSFIGGREDLPVDTSTYNSLLRDAIPKWSTTASPIYLVELEENYNCQPSSCPVGSDGLHPNAMGEYQIARAFSQTLVRDFRIGSSALSIPSDVPTRPLPVPSNFKVFTSPGGVTATWDPVYGAYNYDVRSKIKGGIPNFSSGSVSSNRWDATWPIDGWEYEVQVRASAGDTIKGDWTTTLTATAHPQTAEAPQNVIVSATTTGFDISWDPPIGPYSDSIIEYNVLYWDKDADCDFITGAAFTGTSAHIHSLVTGHRYFVAVETWNAAGQGFPAVVRSVIPGAGTPPPPTDLKIIAADQTTVHLTWDSLSSAAGYRLWLRNVNATGSKLEALNYTVEATCSDQFYLFPGTWNYEWCVSAFNGNAESAKGKCVLAPSPDKDGGASPTCPPAPQWCPNGGGGGGGSSNGTIEEPLPVVTTVHLRSYPRAPPDLEKLGKPIDGTSYFYITPECYSDTSIHNPKFANKAEFIKQAYKDAVLLADQSQDWPLYGTDASDMYFGRDAHKSDFAGNISANIKAVANWDHPRWGFDSYIILDCQNPKSLGTCNSLAGDNRPVICYANNTMSWFWERSTITCCSPFFSLNTISDVHDQNKNRDPNNLDLRYMQTSGSTLLHELMHANAITADRGHMIDENFDEGSTSRKIRIYGPVLCNKAARLIGVKITHKNPDNYAQFASAHYWQKVFGGSVPEPRTSNAAPAGYEEYAYDNDYNYNTTYLATPKDFNCDCNEDGCSEDAFPCCASGTCSCDCNEDGCSPLMPSCCASGTCKF